MSMETANEMLCLKEEPLCGISDLALEDRLSFVDQIEQSPLAIIVKKLLGDPVPIDPGTWDTRFQRIKGWLWIRPTTVPQNDRHNVLCDLLEARNGCVARYSLERSSDPIEMLNEDTQLQDRLFKLRNNQKLRDFRKKLDSNVVGASKQDIHVNEWVLMNDKFNLSTSNRAVREGLVTDADLFECQNWMESALLKIPDGQTEQRLITINTITSILLQRCRLFGTVAADAVLEPLARLETLYTRIRRNKSTLKGYEDHSARSAIASNWNYFHHYDVAMAACIEGSGRGRSRLLGQQGLHRDMSFVPPPAPARADFDVLLKQLVDWAQRKKARSTVEILGAEFPIPRKILAAVPERSRAWGLLEKESVLQERVENARESTTRARHELEALRDGMRSTPRLRQIMDIRDGSYMDSAQVEALGKELGPRVVIVDYIHILQTFTGFDGNVLPMIYHEGRLHSSVTLSSRVSLERLEMWIGAHMDTGKPFASTTDAEEALASLAPLVEPIIRASNPGDTILLSPTQAMFNIPFHAIRTDGQALIERNPVVYTQSLSMFRLSHISASMQEDPEAYKVLAIDALSRTGNGPSKRSAPMAFADKMKDHLCKVDGATPVYAQLLHGPDLTKSALLAALPPALFVDYCGHVGFDEKEPLDHHLDLRNRASERVTARDLFGVRFQNAAHVNLIGCQSGRSQVDANDEVLGLCTAFFYAGAGSIVSTMWSIDEDDGVRFQEAFYDELWRELKALSVDEDEKKATPNMALVLQQTILRLMRDENGGKRAPYHWAAFTVQGYWK